MKLFDSSITFLSQTHWLLYVVLVTLLPCFTWILYFRELRTQVDISKAASVPLIRSAAVLLIAIALFEPQLTREKVSGEPEMLGIIIDTSLSMSLPGSEQSTSIPRIDQASELSFGDNGILRVLGDRFDVYVADTNSSTQKTWSHFARRNSSDEFRPPELIAADAQSALGNAIVDQLNSTFSIDSSGAILLLSDGRTNTGSSLIEAAEQSKRAGVKLFTVGLGPAETISDLAVIAANGPTSLGKQDSFRGIARIRESLPKGTLYSVQARVDGRIVWEQDLMSLGQPAREISFAISAEEMVEGAEQNADAQRNTIALKIDIIARVQEEPLLDPVLQNNQKSLFTQVAIRKRKLLLIDGRHRWETRYINNLFNRDSAWEVTKIVATPGKMEVNGIPESKTELAHYNCVVIGEILPRLLPEEFKSQLVEFVSTGVGGVGFIDGARGYWHDLEPSDFQQLFPVNWDPQLDTTTNQSFKIISQAAAQNLGILDSFGDSAVVGKKLPSLDQVVRVTPQLGAEVLVLAKNKYESRPLLVTRQFGAGIAFYLATDETWKWRYDASQAAHQEFWSQLINLVASVPLSAQNDFAELDTGIPSYKLGEEVPIRAKLRTSSGDPNGEQQVFAKLTNENGEEFELLLREAPDRPGSYSIQARDLQAGNYSVELRSASFPNSGPKLESRFSVLAEENQEYEILTQDEDVLQLASRLTGGQYFTFNQRDELVDALTPISNFKIDRQSKPLWDTAFWFVAAMLLISIDWLLRKRMGLV